MLSLLLDEYYWQNFQADLLKECENDEITTYLFYCGPHGADLTKVATEFFNDFLIVKEGHLKWSEIQSLRTKSKSVRLEFSIPSIIELLENNMEVVQKALLKDVFYYRDHFPDHLNIKREKNLAKIFIEIQKVVEKERAYWEKWRDISYYD